MSQSARPGDDQPRSARSSLAHHRRAVRGAAHRESYAELVQTDRSRERHHSVNPYHRQQHLQSSKPGSNRLVSGPGGVRPGPLQVVHLRQRVVGSISLTMRVVPPPSLGAGGPVTCTQTSGCWRGQYSSKFDCSRDCVLDGRCDATMVSHGAPVGVVRMRWIASPQNPN